MDSTLLNIKHYVPDHLASRDSGGFQDQCKKWKNEYFWICSIVPTAMIVKSSMMFSCLLLCVVVFCSEIGFKTWIFLCMALFCGFCINQQKLIVNCVMTNKKAQNKRMRSV